MDLMFTLKKLKTIYWHALKDKKWHVALQAVELQAKYTEILKYASPQARYPAGRVESEMPKFKGCVNKPASPLNHPPPMHP
jgi:hypothetical protein